MRVAGRLGDARLGAHQSLHIEAPVMGMNVLFNLRTPALIGIGLLVR
jgi:hypothetical protein